MDPGAFAGIWLQNAPNDVSSNDAANAPERPSAVTRHTTVSHKPAKPPFDDGEGGGRRERMRDDIRRRFNDVRPSAATHRRHTSADHRPAVPPDDDDGGVLGGILRRVSDSAAHQKPAEILSDDEQESSKKKEVFLKDMRPRIEFVRRRIEMMHAGEEEFEEYMGSLEETAEKDAEDEGGGECEKDEWLEVYMERLSKRLSKYTES
jgi:hypothetical protein